jgi:hypothetical protein
MKSLLLGLALSCNIMIGYSQIGEDKTQDFRITFISKSGGDISINVLDNTNGTIPVAIILIDDNGQIKKQLKSCKNWTAHNNRTYLLNVSFKSKERIQEAVDQILGSQKLIDSHLYLIQQEDEFEDIETKSGNIKGGQIIQQEVVDLCETIGKINWR